MQGAYIRRFSPNKKHVLAVGLLVIALVLFIIGAYRAARITFFKTDADGSAFSSAEIKENRSIVFKPEIIEAPLRLSDKKRPVVCANVSDGLIGGYDIFIVHLDKYRCLAVRTDSEEYQKVLDGQEITAYFSDEHSDPFTDYVAKMDKYYEPDDVISVSDCGTLGLIVVTPQKECMSFLWGMPFLIIGLFLLKLAGNPFFFFPEESASD